MRMYGTVDGRPVICIGFCPDKNGSPQAICIGTRESPFAVPLAEFVLPKLPKKFMNKVKAYARRETERVQREVAEGKLAH